MKLQIPKETADRSTGKTTKTDNELLPEFVTFSKIKYRAVRVRLLVDLPADFGDERYKANAEIIAGLTDDGYVCVPTIETNGTKDIACLQDDEFEVIECDRDAMKAIAVRAIEDRFQQPAEPATLDSGELPPSARQASSDAASESHEPEEPADSQPAASESEKSTDVIAAENDYLHACREVDRIAAEIDRLQAGHAAAIEAARESRESLCRVLENRLRETLKETDCEVKVKDKSSGRVGYLPKEIEDACKREKENRSQSPVSEQPTGDYSSMSAPISELWSTPIERFGKKKQDALVAACPTIGHFERLREQAGRSFKPLHEMLPDGIGQSVADELEERQLSWMTKNLQAISPSQVDDSSAAGRDDKTIQPKTETEETESHDEIGGDEHREDDEAGQNDNPYNFG